jgi:hypothetical protein
MAMDYLDFELLIAGEDGSYSVAVLAEPGATDPHPGMVGSRHGLDVAAEQRHMAQAIEHLTDRGAVQLNWVEGSTWRDLDNALSRGPWHVFHFVGHGGFDERTGEGLILLESEGKDGALHRFPARDLGRLLADLAPAALPRTRGEPAGSGRRSAPSAKILSLTAPASSMIQLASWVTAPASLVIQPAISVTA